jgi:hypothetical protein
VVSWFQSLLSNGSTCSNRYDALDAAPVPEDAADDAVATVHVTTRDDRPPVFSDGSPSVLVGGRVAQVRLSTPLPGVRLFSY